MEISGRIQKRKSPQADRIQLPIIGKVKVGEKAKSSLGKEYPRSLDYFRCDSKYASLFEKEYGKTPSKIHVIFISDSLQDSCFERYECRDKSGRLSGYSDGNNWYLFNKNTSKYELTDDKTKIRESGDWSATLTLRFIIPKIKGVFGLFQFDTKGINSSIPQIRDAFDTVQSQVGSVINIPFDLTVTKVTSQKPGTKNSFPVVSLIPNIGQENLETLKAYLAQGKDIKTLGMLTENKIKQLTDGKS